MSVRDREEENRGTRVTCLSFLIKIKILDENKMGCIFTQIRANAIFLFSEKFTCGIFLPLEDPNI